METEGNDSTRLPDKRAAVEAIGAGANTRNSTMTMGDRLKSHGVLRQSAASGLLLCVVMWDVRPQPTDGIGWTSLVCVRVCMCV